MDYPLDGLGLSTTQISYVAGVVFAAYIVRGIAGFGAALVAVPLLVLALPPVLVVPIVIALDLVGSAGQAWSGRSHIVWKELLPLVPFTLAGITLALMLHSHLDADIVSIALGIFVLFFSVYQLLPVPTSRVSKMAAAPYGFMGGLAGTLFGTGGPFYVLFLTLRGLEKTPVRSTFAAWFVVDGGVRLTGFAVVGKLDLATGLLFLVALPAALAGLAVGSRIHTGLSQRQFKQLVSGLLLISGIALLAKGF